MIPSSVESFPLAAIALSNENWASVIVIAIVITIAIVIPGVKVMEMAHQTRRVKWFEKPNLGQVENSVESGRARR